jgi:hypothetical protein
MPLSFQIADDCIETPKSMTRPTARRDRTAILLDALYLAVAASIGLSSWWPMLRGDVEPSIATVHRTAGDIQYQPLVYALAHLNLGDGSVLERHGAGVASFPVAALLPHALSVGLLGQTGWVVADVAVSVAYFLLGRLILTRIGLPGRWASLASVALLLGCFTDSFAPLFARGIPFGPFPSFSVVAPHSAFRFPRPFVTEIFALFAVAALLAFCLPDVGRGPKGRRRDALVAGAAVAALAQADIYAAAAVLPVFMLVVAGRLAWELADPERRSLGIHRAVLLLLAASILLAPFFSQRLLEHSDIPRRFGIYPVPRSSATLSTDALRQFVSALIVAAVLAAAASLRSSWRRDPAARRTLLSLACLFILAAGSTVAKPLFIALTGSMVQEYHFDLQFPQRGGLAFAFLAVAAVWLLVGALTRRARGGRGAPLHLERGAAVFCGILVCIWAFRHAALDYRRPLPGHHARPDFFHYGELGNSYLRDFEQLAKELSARASSGLRVLATLDHELAVWWIGTQGGAVLNPDPFVTPLPDAEIEQRLVAFGAATQLSPREFIRFVIQDNNPALNNAYGHNNVVVNLFLGHQKYGGETGWTLRIPPAEIERLRRLYREEAGRDAYRIDALVLFSRGVLSGLIPDPERFVLAYQNDTFRLYVHRLLSVSAPQSGVL